MPGFTQRNARHLPPLRPDVCSGAALAEFERPVHDAELRVDFHGARLHAQRSRLQRRPGMPVYDQHAHTSPNELIGEHQPGRAGPDDQNVSIHRKLGCTAMNAYRMRWFEDAADLRLSAEARQ